MCFFFKQKTAYEMRISDWSSDVCSADLTRERTFPFTLQTTHWASYTQGEPWLVLAGSESTRGKIELVDLRHGVAWRYKSNFSHPRAVLLPEIETGLILQGSGATQIRYLDQE